MLEAKISYIQEKDKETIVKYRLFETTSLPELIDEKTGSVIRKFQRTPLAEVVKFLDKGVTRSDIRLELKEELKKEKVKGNYKYAEKDFLV